MARTTTASKTTPEAAASPRSPTPAAVSPSATPAGTASPGAHPEAEPASNLQPPQFWTSLVVEDGDDPSLGEDAESSTASIASSILRYRTVNGRTYHSESAVVGNTQYWGANDDQQNNSLDIGHHTITLIQDGKLHLAPLPEKLDKVLDIGTGTGIWAIDFADAHPGVHVIGTDLSPIQPTWVPPNLSFEIEDLNQPWTFATDSIDYIHIRWLTGCVKDWTALFENAYRVLKPGGWVEAFDVDVNVQSDDGSVTNETAAGQWAYIFEEGAQKLGLTVSFNPVSENLLRKGIEEAGFENIHEASYKIPLSEWPRDPLQREIGLMTRVYVTNDVEGTVTFMANQLGWSKEQVMVFAAHVRRELRGLKIHAYNKAATVYAQKPLKT